MPVWHRLTKELQESGELVVIGITQEQHPDRCRLFAQWQGFEWPILWDPFNLTEHSVVPIIAAVDEHGLVRSTSLRPDKFDEQFMQGFFEVDYPAPDEVPEQWLPVDPAVLDSSKAVEEGSPAEVEHAIASLIWFRGATLDGEDGSAQDAAIEVLERRAASDDATARDHFRLGVGYRLRYDSPFHRASDFQAAFDQWTEALLQDRNQYIWMRRIQQWGPRLDKPYPFYDWVEVARAEIEARGEVPHALPVPLTGSEVAAKANQIAMRAEGQTNPDPKGEIAADEDGFVGVEVAAALHTGFASDRSRSPIGTARVHVALRPDADRDVHWTNDAGTALVWVSVPDGWRIERSLHELDRPETDTSSEVRRLDFEVVPPKGPPQANVELQGYALYYVCEGELGKCVYRRQDFTVWIPALDLSIR